MTAVAGGAKSFNCPLCGTIQLNKNAKQHIVTLKCTPDGPISDDRRLLIALSIKKNQFVISNDQLIRLNPFVKQSCDRLMIKIILISLGGSILNSDFIPMSLSAMI